MRDHGFGPSGPGLGLLAGLALGGQRRFERLDPIGENVGCDRHGRDSTAVVIDRQAGLAGFLDGFPDKKPGYVTDAVNCAKALLDIGASTSGHWERRIDRVQDKHGLHVGIAIGSLNLLPLRPFARSHIGFIGDALI
jgi:hypothetical protein